MQSQNKNQKTWFKFSKPVLLILLLVAVFIGVAAYLLLKSEPDPTPLKDAAARAQEITRVSKEVQQLSNDQKAQVLAKTAETMMTSQENGLVQYLNNNGFKISQSSLGIYYDKQTDSQLTMASQSKQLEVTYYDYLRTKILAYRAALKISTGEMTQQGKDLVNKYLDNTQTILNAPQLQTTTQ